MDHGTCASTTFPLPRSSFPRRDRPGHLSAICGSDLHLYNGIIPTMRAGDVLGHEFMGEVVDIGSGTHALSRGDRVVVPFAIACGSCYYCREGLTSLCDNSNPNAEMAEALYGFSGSGLFGYSHLYGGYPGGQAEYVRVPFADVGAIRIPSGSRMSACCS
jgi:threonine dehydrogenase-like Zn-dependent dehydrogenase